MQFCHFLSEQHSTDSTFPVRCIDCILSRLHLTSGIWCWGTLASWRKAWSQEVEAALGTLHHIRWCSFWTKNWWCDILVMVENIIRVRNLWLRSYFFRNIHSLSSVSTDGDMAGPGLTFSLAKSFSLKLNCIVFVRALYFDTFVMLWLLCRVCSIIFAHGFDPLLPRIKLGEEHAVLLGCLKSEFYGYSVTCWIPANVYYRQYSLMTFSAVPFLHIKACKYCFKTRWITWAKLFLWAFFTKIGDTL